MQGGFLLTKQKNVFQKEKHSKKIIPYKKVISTVVFTI